MKSLLLAAAVVALVHARPEPPSGYHYNAPSTTFQLPSSGGFSGSFLNSFGPSHGLSSHSVLSSSSGHSHSGLSSHGFSSSGLGGGLDGLSLPSSGGSLNFGGSSFSGGFSGLSGLSQFTSGPALVQKHIYVHVPPPEPEYQQPQRVLPVSPPQKHYKIIFIKAPSPPTPTVPAIPLQPQDQEKTLVYVLVKKPDEAPEINVPIAPPTPPSKPEVYFIKYKTKKEGASLGGSLGDLSLSGLGGGLSLSSGSVGSSSGSLGSLSSGLGSTSVSFDGSSGGSLSSLSLHGSSLSSSSSSGSLSTSYGTPSKGLSTSYGPPKSGHY